MNWRGRLKRAFIILIVGIFSILSIIGSLSAFPGTTNAAVSTAQALRKNISVTITNNETLEANFKVRACKDGWPNNKCGSTWYDGKVIAKYEKTVTNINFTNYNKTGGFFGIYDVEEARVYKVDSSSFTPKWVSYGDLGQTTVENNWNNIRIYVAYAADVESQGNIGFLSEIRTTNNKSSGSAFDQDSIANAALSSSVQEAFRRGYNSSGTSLGFVSPVEKRDAPPPTSGTGVDKYCRNNSLSIKSVSMSLNRLSSNFSQIRLDYSVSHVDIGSGQIGVVLYQIVTHSDTGEELFLTAFEVNHLADESDKRKKDSTTSSSGTTTMTESSTEGTIDYVLLVYSPGNTGFSKTPVSGEETIGNRCSDVTVFDLDYDTTKPPAPTGVKISHGSPSIPELGDKDLGWLWAWSESEEATFEMVFTTPENRGRVLLDRGKTLTEGKFRQNVVQYIAYGGDPVLTFGVVATVNEVESDISRTVTINYDRDGKMISFSQSDGKVITRSELAKESPIGATPAEDDTCSILWIVSGDGNWINPFDKGEPDVLKNIGIDGEKLNPFSRMSVCLYLWTIVPFTEWAAGLIENVGGIAINSQNYYLSKYKPEFIDA